jgi:hypothetical protein
MGEANFDDLAAELLAQPVDEFTSRRNARVKELKASGQSDLANKLATLKKPSLALWAVNQVAARNRAGLDELRKAAQALTKAQAAAAAGRTNAARELRAASEEFQRRLDAAVSTAASALRDRRHSAGEEALRQIREMLRLAVLKGGDPWRQLETGALTTEPRPGEDLVEVFGMGSGPAADRRAERSEARRAKELAQKAAKADAERAQRAAATAQRLRQEANEALAAAKRAAERAKAAEDEATRSRSQAKKSQRCT